MRSVGFVVTLMNDGLTVEQGLSLLMEYVGSRLL